MATNTYVALSKQTVSVAAANITFSAIPATYTDLVLVLQGAMVANARVDIYVGNGTVDTGANYSNTSLFANGVATTTTSLRNPSTSSMQGMFDSVGTGTNQVNSITHFQNYANTSVRKTVMGRFNSNSNGTGMFTGLWRSTSAIDIITLTGTSNFAVGTTASLYGIRAEGVSPAPKATGGAIYSDATYYYHAFGASGTFTPTQSITADVLVVSGGGGGSQNFGGGGGAGGITQLTSQSLTATAYTVTVGAGAAAGTSGVSVSATGSVSTFNGTSPTGGTGSKGGGGGQMPIGGASGNGFAAGLGGDSADNTRLAGGSGGGAGAAGSAASSSSPGARGGNGATSALINSIGAVVGVGENVSGTYYIGGGGGGGGESNYRNNSGWGVGFYFGPCDGGYGGGGNGGNGDFRSKNGADGRVNTGSGGGGGAWDGAAGAGGVLGTGGAGGSGVVIVRYAKV
jgi:hypothetical protein